MNDFPSEIAVRISLPGVSADLLKSRAEELCEGKAEIHVQSERPRFRSPDPPVLVALIAAAASILGALIMAVLTLAKERGIGQIVVSVGDTKVEMPANAPIEKVKELVDLITRSQTKNIVIRSESEAAH